MTSRPLPSAGNKRRTLATSAPRWAAWHCHVLEASHRKTWDYTNDEATAAATTKRAAAAAAGTAAAAATTTRTTNSEHIHHHQQQTTNTTTNDRNNRWMPASSIWNVREKQCQNGNCEALARALVEKRTTRQNEINTNKNKKDKNKSKNKNKEQQ